MNDYLPFIKYAAIALLIPLVAFALRRPLTRLVTATFAAPYTLLAELLSGVTSALDAYRVWWREQFPTPSVRSFLGSAVLAAFLALLIWVELHLQAPTLDSLLKLDDQKTITLPLFGASRPFTTGEAFALAMIVMESIFGVFVLEAAGATHFFPLSNAAAPARTVVGIVAGVALLVCCAGQASLTAWRILVTQQEAAIDPEPEQVVVTGRSDLWNHSFPETAPSHADGDAGSAPPTRSWWMLNLPWFVGAVVAFLLPLCAAAAGLAFYHLSLTSVALAGFVPMLALVLVAFILNWLMRAVGAVEQVVRHVMELVAAFGSTLALRRPPDDAVSEAAESQAAPSPIPEAPSHPSDADVVADQAEEIEALRDRLRDAERQDRKRTYRAETDPFGFGQNGDDPLHPHASNGGLS